MTEESLFAAALERSDAAERHVFLDEACAGDVALRERVERLLAAHDLASGILDDSSRPTEKAGDSAAETPGDSARSEGYGSVVSGRYRLLKKIGEGGMGTVWAAEQTQPMRREVALKLIKAGMDSKSVLARFDAERQALALMDHPNIARVLDGGTTESGRPFFVMEYVRGVPLTRFCDEARLTIDQRLALFIPVCQAVQHAHQKGVIHRDLKPGNILVCQGDDGPIPKVIDFGLAKAIGQPLTEHTLHTGHGHVLGTPLYMSPEQAEPTNLDVDTRADIYALGVILYELLTGTTPLEGRRLRRAAWHEMLRMIREEEPPSPSTRLCGSDSLPSVAEQRQLEPVQLTRLVRGELDWIAMKCLEKDRSRRYDSANGLARDLGRYLEDEPVEAGPPSASYRLTKFVRKHRGALGTAATIAGVLVLAAGISTRQAVRATLAEAAARRAEGEARAQRDAAVAEKERADGERAIAGAVAEFLQEDLLGQADIANRSPDAGRNRDITVRVLLDRAARGIEARFKGRGPTESAIRLTLGKAYRALGEYDRAREQLQRALELRRRDLGADHRETLESEAALAIVYDNLGRYDDSERSHKRVLEARTRGLGADHPDTLQSMSDLGLLYCDQARFDDAEPLLLKSLELRRARLGDEDPDTLTSMANLAYLHYSRGQYAAAEPWYKRVWDGWRARLGPDHPETLKAMDGLATTYQMLKRLDEAEPLFERELALSRAGLGPDHPDTLVTMHNLGVLYRDRGRLAEAEPLLRAAAEGAARKLGLSYPKTSTFIDNFADLHDKLGTPHLAEPLLRDLVSSLRDRPGTDPVGFSKQLWFLAGNLCKQEKYPEAERVLRECVDVTTRHTPDSWRPSYMRSLLGDALLHQRRFPEAEPLLLEGYRGMKSREDQIPERFRSLVDAAAGRLVRLYEAWSRPAQAAEWRSKLPRTDAAAPKS